MTATQSPYHHTRSQRLRSPETRCGAKRELTEVRRQDFMFDFSVMKREVPSANFKTCTVVSSKCT